MKKFLPLLFFIVTGIYFVFADFAHLKLNTADASTYLNIGENTASGKGFRVSYNLYQGFKELYHPVWPYIYPVYPLLCSVVFFLGGAMEQVIKLNIFILGLNAALVFYLLRQFIPNLLSVLLWVSIIFSFHFYFTAFYAWTEQLHLFFFLSSFILFLRNSNNSRMLWLLGAFNGMIMLLRFAHVYTIGAYLLVIFLMGEGHWRERIKNAFYFLAGVAVVFGGYQSFNWLAYHSFYPESSKSAADYIRASKMVETVYDANGKFVLPPPKLSVTSIYFWTHVKDFLILMPFWAVFTLFSFSKIFNRKEAYFVWNCLFQSILIILGYCYTFSWLNTIDSLRYCLIPITLTGIAGCFCFYKILFEPPVKWQRLCVVAAALIMTWGVLYNYVRVRENLLEHPTERIPYYQSLFQSYAWIDKNLPKDALIASDEDQQAFLMHRPFISTPIGKSLNCGNLKMHNKIFKPDYYLLSYATLEGCFDGIPHRQVFINKRFEILQIYK